MKGIVLAGGSGKRLYPVTKAVSKHLLPIYDKPLIYYPLSVLMLAGIREILIITTPDDLSSYKKLLSDGEGLGISIKYRVQDKPRGVADAFIVGEKFIGDDSVCLVLGDNIFYGQNLTKTLCQAFEENMGATIFGVEVTDPRPYGVVEFDQNKNVISIEEKPKAPKSNYAVPGLYIYDNQVVEIAKGLTKSARGELEITDVNNKYFELGRLKLRIFGRGMVWMDSGSPKGNMEASEFVHTLQTMQGLYIGCIEEIAWRRGYIDDIQLKKLGKELEMTDYGKYLLSLVK